MTAISYAIWEANQRYWQHVGWTYVHEQVALAGAILMFGMFVFPLLPMPGHDPNKEEFKALALGIIAQVPMWIQVYGSSLYFWIPEIPKGLWHAERLVWEHYQFQVTATTFAVVEILGWAWIALCVWRMFKLLKTY